MVNKSAVNNKRREEIADAEDEQSATPRTLETRWRRSRRKKKNTIQKVNTNCSVRLQCVRWIFFFFRQLPFQHWRKKNTKNVKKGEKQVVKSIETCYYFLLPLVFNFILLSSLSPNLSLVSDILSFAICRHLFLLLLLSLPFLIWCGYLFMFFYYNCYCRHPSRHTP